MYVSAQGPHPAAARIRLKAPENRLVLPGFPVAGFETPAETLPLGTDVWVATRLRLPTGVAAYTNLFTGEAVGVEAVDGSLTASVASLFGTCPVAVLVT